VGMFCGLVPGPVQMLTAALLAIVFRVNLPVAVVVTWYTNPFTIVPLYYLAYRLGAFVTGQNASTVPGPQLDLTIANFSEWLPMLYNWIAAAGKPFAVGLVSLAAILAVTGYFAVLGAWRLYVIAAWRRRLQARARAQVSSRPSRP